MSTSEQRQGGGAEPTRPRLRTGIILPSFRSSPDEALVAADAADAAGVDGVFCYDHLWPMGQPERPALAPFPLLGAVATRTEHVRVGTLMARVGLVPDEVLLSEFAALDVIAPGRVVAGLGTGDRLSAAENLAYGVAYEPAAARRTALARCARTLVGWGIPVWVGAGSAATSTIAEIDGLALNLWDVSPDELTDHGRRGEVTWAGPAPKGPEADGQLQATVTGLAPGPATWVVFGWPVHIDVLVRAAREARDER